MKTIVKVKELSHEDLVNLLSTASYGSPFIRFSIPKGNYKGTELEDENDCLEDKWAKVLIAGKHLFFCDNYAEDEDDFYGQLPHAYKNTPWGGFMRYEFTLQTILDAMSKALSEGDYMAEYVNHLANYPEKFDQIEAEAVMQYVIFGEEIYG